MSTKTEQCVAPVVTEVDHLAGPIFDQCPSEGEVRVMAEDGTYDHLCDAHFRLTEPVAGAYRTTPIPDGAPF